MVNSKSIGNKISAARKKINLSQAELALQISISPQAVGKWERGESMPDISTLTRLAGILGVDLNYFSEHSQSQDTESRSIPNLEKIMPENDPNSKKKFDWNWNMSQGNWMDADFSGLTNIKEKFSSSNIKNCKFLNSDLSGLILGKNNISLCDFSGSDLRESKIQSSNLLNNLFNKCAFIDAEFYKSNIEKCDFSEADCSGTEFIESNVENCTLENVNWMFTKFLKSNLSHLTFSGLVENGHFEHCGFYNVKFENATILNTFFKYNERFKKVQFINCQVDSITFAFLKNNQANLSGITLLT
ncbi:MAG: pentapeptide repeat-containing protein [Bacteroidia bacterium]|nr:pentapeptide repeat-containing protein [Bacteroidia bacterium]